VQELTAKGSQHHQVQVAAKSWRSLKGALDFRRLLLQLRPDIVHVRSRIPGWVVELAYRTLPKQRRPVRITTFHGFYSVNRYSAIMTRGEKIIAVSRTIAEHIQQAYGVPESKIVVIYRGIDPVAFDPARIDRQSRLDERQRWQVPDAHTPVVLMPGRFTRLKGHLLLLHALAAVMDLPWLLVFVGDHQENPHYTQELLELADRLGLRSRLRLHGLCTDMPLVYAASDLVLNVSTRPESFGRTTVEAMAMAKPVIVAGHGGGLETILPGKTGWHFIPDDSVDLARVLRQAFVDQEQWQSIGARGREHVRTRFSLQAMCSQTLSVYHSVNLF
jgi:glycosyltransferase involved in cell wall biosynthesis